MKKYILFYYLLVGLAFYSCKENTIGQQPLHHNTPDPVTDVQVQNIPGGAVLTYNLPDNEDLLYVKASYTLTNGEKSEQRSSLYNNGLIIEGFGDTLLHQVDVVAVDRSQNESAPVTVTIKPQTPPVWTIEESLQLVEDFGGVHAYWTNPTGAKISVVVLKKDANDEFVPLETFYSESTVGEGAARGLEAEEGEFQVYVRDKWLNRSKPQFHTLTPIYERMLDKGSFLAVNLPGDAAAVGGWEKHKMWDGQFGETLGYSSPGGGTNAGLPHSVTIDLGVVARLSRIKVYQRTGNSDDYIFNEGNPREFRVYGCETIDMSGGWESWDLMMECESIKPSGYNRGMNSSDDVRRAKEGEDFECSPLNPKVRYIRLYVMSSWSGGSNFQIAELDIFGDDRSESDID